jgi:hypothetical protein
MSPFGGCIRVTSCKKEYIDDARCPAWWEADSARFCLNGLTIALSAGYLIRR